MIPLGVQATLPFIPSANLPILFITKPSTSFSLSIRFVKKISSKCLGKGNCNNIPVTSSFLFNLSITLATPILLTSASRCITSDIIPTSSHFLTLLATYFPLAKSSPTLIITNFGCFSSF